MYTATQDDLDDNGANPIPNGFVDSTATADSVQSAPASDSEQVEVVQNPAIDIVKTFDPTTVPQGTDQEFTLVVTNTGNVTLTDVLVEDDFDDSLKVTGVLAPQGADANVDGDQSVAMGPAVVKEPMFSGFGGRSRGSNRSEVGGSPNRRDRRLVLIWTTLPTS